MMTQAEFYQIHLDRVSRSFAFCIAQLTSPMREWVGLSYLLCRILDTVEDSTWPAQAAQFQAFALFDQALLDASKIIQLENWASLFPHGLSSGEKMLLEDAAEILEDLHRLPQDVQAKIQSLVRSMSQGMQHFAAQNKAGTLYLHNLDEVNQYCFFVAGLVGELLCELLAEVEKDFSPDQTNVTRAHQFGLFLQKVNLLKDQAQDEKSGRNLIPSRQIVEQSARENAVKAFEFLLKVPVHQVEFRRFCAWSLFLGLEAVSVARADQVAKIPRVRAEEIVLNVEVSLPDPQKLRSLFDAAFEKLGWNQMKAAPHTAAVIPEWLYGIYQGHLSRESLAEVLN
jgi:phytoene/squalene synthetase